MLKELELVIERLMKRIAHLIEGGQEAGIEHAGDLQAAVNGLKIHVAVGAETISDLAVQGSNLAAQKAGAALSSANAEVQSAGAAIVGTPAGTDVGKAGEEVHTIGAELSGADQIKQQTAIVSEGSATNTSLPNIATPPGGDPNADVNPIPDFLKSAGRNTPPANSKSADTTAPVKAVVTPPGKPDDEVL